MSEPIYLICGKLRTPVASPQGVMCDYETVEQLTDIPEDPTRRAAYLKHYREAQVAKHEGGPRYTEILLITFSLPSLEYRGTCMTIRDLLHTVDPYAGFNHTDHGYDAHGWGSHAPIFGELIRQVRPQLIVEVGSWKGASALHMAKLAQAEGLSPEIVCIDTWLGSVEMWENKDDAERYLSLGLKHGYPALYYQFLANVVYAGAQQAITPFPQTATAAAIWLDRFAHARADLIYIDGSHEYADVITDLRHYWPLLRHGGVMFGDDLFTFMDVNRAVADFEKEIGLQITLGDRHWQIQKR